MTYLDPNSEMALSVLSSTISEQPLPGQEGQSNTKTDLAGQSLISSEEWLQLHGLKNNKLTLKQILSQIGFPHCEGRVLRKQHILPETTHSHCLNQQLPKGVYTFQGMKKTSARVCTTSIYFLFHLEKD